MTQFGKSYNRGRVGEREDVFKRHNYQKLQERNGGEESASPLNLI